MKPIHDSEMDEVCRADDLRPTVVDSESAASETPAAIRYDEELRCLTEGTALSMSEIPLAGTLRLLHDVLRCGQKEQFDTADTLLAYDADPVPGTGYHLTQARFSSALPSRFQIRRMLGKGGFGIVYLATDTLLQRDVAIKLPHQMVLNSGELQERFLRESRAIARLNHPSVVRVLDSGAEAGLSWQITEYVDGPSLREYRRQHQNGIPAKTAARILLQLADAVQHAHDQGVLHRDIKPDNILLEKLPGHTRDALPEVNFVPRLTDFGLARLIDDITISRSGLLIGTPMYMAPEQLKGQPSLQGPWTDIYSLGVVLYEMLTGTIPFAEATSLHSRIGLAEQPVGRFRTAQNGIPRDLETICLTCLNVQPNARYASAGILRDDLQRFLEGRPTLARPLPALEKFSRWRQRNRTLAASIFVVLVSVLIVFGQTLSSYIVSQRQNQQLTGTLNQLKKEKQRSDSLRELADKSRLHAEENESKFRTLAWNSTIREALTVLQQRRFFAVLSHLETLRQSHPEMIHRTDWQLTSAELEHHFSSVCNLGHPLHEMRLVPGANQLVVCGDSSNVSLIDSRTYQPIRSFPTGVPRIHAIAVSADGKRIAVGGSADANDQAVPMIYSLETGELLQTFSPQSTTIDSLLFTSDGKSLVCGCRYEPVKVFTITDGVESALKTTRRNQWLAESPDGSRIAVHETDQTVLVVSLDDPEATRTLSFPDDIEIGIWIPNTSVLACSNYQSKYIELVDTVTGQIVVRLLHSGKAFTSLVVCESQQRLYAGRDDGSIVCWDIPAELFLPPASGSLATTSRIESIKEVPENETVFVDDQPITSMIVSEQELFCSTASGRIAVYRFPLLPNDDSGRIVNQPRWRSAAIHGQSGDVFIGENDGRISTLRHRDFPFTRRGQVSFAQSVKNGLTSVAVLDKYAVDGLVVSPNESHIAWSNWTQQVQVAELPFSHVIEFSAAANTHNGGVDAIAFSPDGISVAWTGSEKLLCLRKLHGTTGVQTLPLAGYGNSLSYSPRLNQLACGGSFDQLIIVDCNTMSPQTTIDHCRGCTAICWHSSEKSLLLGFNDGSVQIRSLTDSTKVRLTVHRREVRRIALSPDKKLAVSVDQSGQVALWHPETGELSGILFEPRTTAAGIVGKEPVLEFVGSDQLMLVYDNGDDGPQVLQWRFEK